MEIILLERVQNLGQMGDKVVVKDGYARNFLLPQKKALRATKANVAYFDTQKAQLEANNLEKKSEAEALAEKINGESFVLIRSASDKGQLYGSVTSRDIAGVVTEGGFTVGRNQVVLDRALKSLGLYEMVLTLHPEVSATVVINIARSAEEAELQAAGESIVQDFEEEANDEDIVAEIEAEEAAEAEAAEAAEGEEEAAAAEEA